MDFIEPAMPSLPTLNDPLFYPQAGGIVPDAVEFQFNPTLRSVESIKIESSLPGGEPQEILSNGAIDVLASGACFRFGSEGLQTATIRGTNHMGFEVSGQVQFVVQGLGASVKTCLPWSGGRTYFLSDPFWKPSVSGGELPPLDGVDWEKYWGAEVRLGDSVWPASWTRYSMFVIEKYAHDLLRDSYVPTKEKEKLCPRFARFGIVDRQRFWALFIASIAYPESRFNPRTRYREPAPLSKWSEGLLQLSVDDYVSHGAVCNFMKKPEKILDPFENIRCGVVILKNQIAHRKTLWPSTYYYWSVLSGKKSSLVRQVFRDNVARFLPACGN